MRRSDALQTFHESSYSEVGDEMERTTKSVWQQTTIIVKRLKYFTSKYLISWNHITYNFLNILPRLILCWTDIKLAIINYRAEGALTVRGRGMWNLRLAVSAFVCLFVCPRTSVAIARSRLKITPRDLPYLQNNQKWYFKRILFLCLVPWGAMHMDICDFSDQMLSMMLVANPRIKFEKVSGPLCLRRPMPCTAGSSNCGCSTTFVHTVAGIDAEQYYY